MVLKDWYLCRVTLILTAMAGALCVGLLYLRQSGSSFVGLTGALIAAILLSVLTPIQTIVQERKQQNLAFVMSLPISPMQYTAAKILGNFSAFLLVWLAIAGGVIGTIARAGGFGGVIPLAVITSLAPFVAFCLLVSVAIVTESELVTLVTMGACNVSYSFGWFVLMRVPGLSQNLKSPIAVWSEPVVRIIAGELALSALCLGLTFYFQSRKTSFV
jgi:ABC-type transport system involved in multi-copper enzyme maturation permease subunit